MFNHLELDSTEVSNLLYDNCDLRTIYTKENGSMEMTDDNDIIENFVPALIEYINDKMSDIVNLDIQLY